MRKRKNAQICDKVGHFIRSLLTADKIKLKAQHDNFLMHFKDFYFGIFPIVDILRYIVDIRLSYIHGDQN
jgi:hypothetical protein